MITSIQSLANEVSPGDVQIPGLNKQTSDFTFKLLLWLELGGVVDRSLCEWSLCVAPVSDRPLWSWLGCLTELRCKPQRRPRGNRQSLKTAKTQTPQLDALLFLFGTLPDVGGGNYGPASPRFFVGLSPGSFPHRRFQFKAYVLFSKLYICKCTLLYFVAFTKDSTKCFFLFVLT